MQAHQAAFARTCAPNRYKRKFPAIPSMICPWEHSLYKDLKFCCTKYSCLKWNFMFLCINISISKKLWRHPQQPQRFIFTIFSEAYWEAKRWKHLGPAPQPQSLPDGPDLLRNLLWNLPGTFSGTLLNLTCQSLPDLLRNFLRNPVEPDLALHQSLPDCFRILLRNLLRNLLNLTCQSLPDLLRNFLRNPVEPDLALHQSLPDCFRILLRNLLRNPVELHLALRQGFLEPFSEPFSEPFPEPCWTWSRSAPKPPRPLRNLRNLFRNLVDRRLHQCTPELFWAEDPISIRYPEQIHIGIYESEYITSSTAQGRGGSFKNRKPIGEVGCCESRMAERSHWWIGLKGAWSLSLFLSLFLSLSFSAYLPTCLSISPFHLSSCLPVYLCCSVIQCNVV